MTGDIYVHPQDFIEEDTDDLMNPPQQFREHGLTKREYFAAMAMQGILTNPDGQRSDQAAVTARLYADALLNELEKTQ